MYGDANLLKFGLPSRITNVPGYLVRHNYAVDSTLDEFIHYSGWSASTQGSALAQWSQGRYRLPVTSNEGVYTSPLFALPAAAAARQLPPPSSIPPPSGYPAVTPPPAAATTGQFRMMGVAWTLFGETLDPLDPNLRPQMYDYQSVLSSATPSTLNVQTEVSLFADGAWSSPATNDAFSSILNPLTGTPLTVTDPTQIRYRVRFTWPSAPLLTAQLLATPYVDDITLYYDAGGSPFLAYHME